MYPNFLKNNFLTPFLTVLVFTVLVRAQSPTSSPYSRFGIGELERRGFGQIAALGGTHLALANDSTAPFFINSGNPASYSSIRLSCFEAGLQHTYSNFANSTKSVITNNTTLNYAAVAFPLRRRAGAAFGLLPFSNIGYQVRNSVEVENIGTVTEQYDGSGGLNQLFLGIGIRPFFQSSPEKTLSKLFSNLSLGVNANYIFGTLNNTGRLIFPSGTGIFNTKRTKETEIKDFTANAGAQWHFFITTHKGKVMEDPVKISFGYHVSLPSALKAYASHVNTTFVYGTQDREFVRDTVLYEKEIAGTINLPLSQGVGICIKKGHKFTFCADAEITNWGSYRFFNETNAFKDSKRFSVGLQYVPNRFAVGPGAYLRKIQYRAGFRYQEGFLELKNSRINDNALSIGAGLPMGRYKLLYQVNLSLEIGQNGTVANNLIKQQYLRATLGFTFNDRWFIKTKYD